MERVSCCKGSQYHSEGSGVAIYKQSWERLKRCLPQRSILLVEEMVHESHSHCRDPKEALKEDNSRVQFQRQ